MLYIDKNVLFHSYSTQFYSSQLWYNFLKSSYQRIKAACNDAFRMLHNASARKLPIQHDIITFDPLLQKCMYILLIGAFTPTTLSLKVLFTLMYFLSLLTTNVTASLV